LNDERSSERLDDSSLAETALPLWFVVDDKGFRFKFADATLATEARTIFVLYLRGQVDLASDLFAVEIVFGKLIGNVARHAPGPVEVAVAWEEHCARLEVLDRGPGYALNADLPQDDFAESQRGLFLVAAYGEDLQVKRRDGFTITSVTLPVRRSVQAT
jgi:anti-sigma regulatory factor (Ser/Thr protein kinase)